MNTQRKTQPSFPTVDSRPNQPSPRPPCRCEVKAVSTLETLQWHRHCGVDTCYSHEPVPQPRIRSHLLTSTLEGCNVTLHCQGSGKGNVSISWGRGNPVQELDPGRHQLSPDGSILQLSLQPSSLNATYTCTVSNPVDQKIIAFDLQSICRSGDADASFSKPGYIVLTFFLLVLSLGTAVWCWRMNNEKSADPAATPTGPVEESPSDPQYAEIMRSPPEGNDQALRHLENNTERSPQKEPLITTIYDKVHRTPENTSEEVT